MKGSSLLLIVVNILLVGVIIVSAGVVWFINGDYVGFSRADSLSIEYQPNQKQTTFFGREEYQPPTSTPIVQPTRPPRTSYQPIPTSPPNQPQPNVSRPPSSLPSASQTQAPGVPQNTPVPIEEPQGNICPPDTVNPSGCVCDSRGSGGAYESHMCNDPQQPDRKVVYFSRPGLNRYMILKGPPWDFPSSISQSDLQAAIRDPSCVRVCIEYDKPVLYLYPEKPTLVDVKLEVPGFVIVSIPEYPDEGWQNVLAYPDGKLIYKGKTYSDLFYETSVFENPSNRNEGFLISRKNLSKDLDRLITAYGLRGKERKDFLDYWVPRLTEEGGAYYFTRVLTWDEKNKVDLVHINPPPDTFIHLLVEFQAVPESYEYKEQPLPKKVPQRKGFTVVEWGGRVIK